MSALLHRRFRRTLLAVLMLCCLAAGAAAAESLHDGDHTDAAEDSFSVLILGDSQMAGAGWDGGYENCIREAYPGAQVLNLAQNGSLLANGDIHAQWEFYLEEGFPQVDFILLDGGVNDLPYMRREEFRDTGLALVQESLSSLLGLIQTACPEAHIIYVLMPPLVEWKDSETGPPAYEIQARYWKQLNILANAYENVTVLDLFSLNPFHFPCAQCYQEYFADSIHLSEAGYRETFGFINNIFMARLSVGQEE